MIYNINLDKASPTPMYIQLAQQLETLINSNTLVTGDRLPPIRKLAKELEVNNITIVNAYKQLEQNGLISALKGSGYYVAEHEIPYIPSNSRDVLTTTINTPRDGYGDNMELMSNGQIEVNASTINFASATPDPSIFPIEAFKAALNEVLDRDKGYAFGYQESNGYEPLRESLCDYFLREDGITASPTSIQIVSGAQQGIDIIGKSLLNSGDYVITENPTYTGATAVFKSRGANVIGIPMESDGINIDILETSLMTYKPKLIYLMTQFQNPTTITYSMEKLKKLLYLADKYNVYIVEDDSLSGLSYDNKARGTTLKALDYNDRVIYIKSFSKLLMPGLRIGFLIAPAPLVAGLLAAKHTTDISSSGLIQRALQLYFKNGHWEQHLNYMKEIYKEKYKVILEELNKLKEVGISFMDPKGGLNFWINLPKGVSATKLYEECAKNDLLLVPCNLFYVNKEKNKDNAIRISYAATNAEEIRAGISIIKDCIVRLQKTTKKNTYISPLI